MPPIATSRLIECVPNVSEGTRSEVIAGLARAIAAHAPQTRLLDVSSDVSHNRTVFTMAGTAASLEDAVLGLFEAARESIDLRYHQGVHPRVGAVDVVPFVPLHGVDMQECVGLARTTARAVAERLSMPVYLYEEAALDPDRRNLAEIRRGGFESLPAKMRDRRWRPDFGPLVPHPTMGVAVIGARPILIAFNVNLDSADVTLAKRIARAVRASSGGFAGVKALGLLLDHRGIAQVSMNLTDYKSTSLMTVFDAVERLAAAEGVRVLESELVGLVPEDALPADPTARLKLPASAAEKTIERRLHDASS